MNDIVSIKFGGTSMGTSSSINESASIIIECLKKNKVLVTVSAVTKITDYLVSIFKSIKDNGKKKIDEEIKFLLEKHLSILEEITKKTGCFLEIKKLIEEKIKELESIIYECIEKKEFSEKIEAKILSFGEKLSSYLMLAALRKNNIDSERIESEELIKTNSKYIESDVNWYQTKSLCQKTLNNIINQRKIAVITGFIGSDSNGDTTLLGRGGSDYTASILAATINAKEIQIWTDVDGVMSADPRIIKNAKLLEKIDIDVMGEMAYCGAKVLHHKSIYCAVEKKIPVYVLNTFNRKSKGTLVSNFKDSNPTISIVCSKNNALYHLDKVSMNTEVGFIEKISKIVSEYGISMDVCVTSETTFSFSTKENEKTQTIFEKIKELSSVELYKNISKISIIGYGIKMESIINSLQALLLNKIKIHSILFGKSERNVTLLIDNEKSDECLSILHKVLVH